MKIAFVILGEPASKANSREIVTRRFRSTPDGPLKTRPVSIKSDKALAYERDALRQVPPKARVRLEGPVRVTLRIWYATERPDLDESVILDVLQDRYERKPDGKRVLVHRGVYRNDRQVRQKFVFHGIDRANPRAEVVVEPLQAQQIALALDNPEYDPFEEVST
ncbi:RusA family crossover junction endodeoxyribonuclease [Paraburkholderia sp. HD33-4]|uniref:RusA family crossover junction endodeoxyribonuclease n=1 Tax=Paraburkholderia sp. HD33-4 TaxID=2883242 RepID=UPI001F2E9F64|nr:RusA family crossover junction endodeoxyribonuclease [Paraburkholderia sp. HD33-4]